jgi:signal peptidase I
MSKVLTVPPIRTSDDAPASQRRPRVFGVLASLLLWPGVGHFFVGRFLAGVLWAGAPIAFIATALIHPALVLLGIVGMRLLAALDVGLRPVRSTPEGGRVVAGVLGVLVAVAILLGLVRAHFLEGFKIPTASMAPTLLAGDRVFVNKLAYRFGDVARGDLIVFTSPCEPDRTRLQRLIGLPGDTIEVRCDVVYVNERATPQRQLEGDCSYWDPDDSGRWQRRTCSRYVESLHGREYEIIHSAERARLDRERASNPSGVSDDLAGRHDFPDQSAPSCDFLGGASAGGPPRGRIEDSPGAGPGCAPRRHFVVPQGQVFVLGDNRDNSSDSRAWGTVPIENISGRLDSIWWSSGSPDEGIRWSRIGAVD